MTWNNFVVLWLLVTYIVGFGHSRAIPAISHTCSANPCENTAWNESSLDNILTNYELDNVTTKWQSNDHELFHKHRSRAVALALPKPIKPPTVAPNKPNSPATTPSVNPQEGLNPDKPRPTGNASPIPSFNPQEGLNPDKPRPTGDSYTSPGSNPPKVDPVPSPANDGAPGTQPSLPAANDLGCGMKRADACPGPSDNIGADVPGAVPDTASDTRSGRPADTENGEYDFLDEVQRERGTVLVNDKLQNLDDRINNQVPDAPIRNDEISSAYQFDSKNKNEEGNGPDNVPLSFDNMFDKDLDHQQFNKLFDLAGIKLTDTRAEREAVKSPGSAQYTLRTSWSGDQKVLFADWSYKKHDNSALEPKPHFTELMMATLKSRNVDPKNIQAIARTRIANDATMKTIDSIYKSLGAKPLTDDPIVLSRSDTDVAKKEAFDAFFRTDNGKGTLNLLTFHANDWGRRRPDKLVIQRTGLNSGMYSAVVTLA